MTTKSNWITFIGVPNSGKSTLLNKLIGTKISIVSPKVQTTRSLLKGIKVIDDTQLVFTDTPGIFQTAKSNLEKHMLNSAWGSLQDANTICLIMDCTKANNEENQSLLKNLQENKVKFSLILNKIDLIQKDMLLPLIAQLSKEYEFENIFIISALKADGLHDLEKHFVKTAIDSPWHYNADDITDAPLRYLVAELIREKIFFNADQELPYNMAVEIDKWEDTGKLAKISATIKVVRQAHKKMIIGSGGLMLKKIGTQARHDIESLLAKKVFLTMFVKVTDWHNNIREMVDYN